MPRVGEIRFAPYWTTTDGSLRLYLGDVIAVLKKLPAKSVQMVVTSPPYWGLRDYGTAEWEGGDANCDHAKSVNLDRSDREARNEIRDDSQGTFAHPSGWRAGGRQASDQHWEGKVCGRCGARRIDSQIGSEKTPTEFVEKMVEVFREIRRVLRDDGTCWLNLGDSYNQYKANSGRGKGLNKKSDELAWPEFRQGLVDKELGSGNLVGIPWRVALALQADGWVLRQDIIWSKPSPMPESVKNRCTKSHEYIFLLTKSMRYFYDAEAIKTPAEPAVRIQKVGPGFKGKFNRSSFLGNGKTEEQMSGNAREGSVIRTGNLANKRSVWTVSSQGYEGAHFATFPPKLIEPCILAGTSEYGCCTICSAPWKRVVEESGGVRALDKDRQERDRSMKRNRNGITGSLDGVHRTSKTLGWEPTCSCETREVKPCMVLDPFCGSGTTLEVCLDKGRYGVGIDLSEAYLKQNAIPRLEGALLSRPSSSHLAGREAEAFEEGESV